MKESGCSKRKRIRPPVFTEATYYTNAHRENCPGNAVHGEGDRELSEFLKLSLEKNPLKYRNGTLMAAGHLKYKSRSTCALGLCKPKFKCFPDNEPVAPQRSSDFLESFKDHINIEGDDELEYIKSQYCKLLENS